MRAKEIGFSLPTIISPLAYVSDNVVIGEGTIIMHGAIINSGAKIGSNCIINTRSIIEHETIVEDHCHINRYDFKCSMLELNKNHLLEVEWL